MLRCRAYGINPYKDLLPLFQKIMSDWLAKIAKSQVQNPQILKFKHGSIFTLLGSFCSVSQNEDRQKEIEAKIRLAQQKLMDANKRMVRILPEVLTPSFFFFFFDKFYKIMFSAFDISMCCASRKIASRVVLIRTRWRSI